MSTKATTTTTKKVNVMKYKELITRTESEINKELLDLEVEKAANVLQQGKIAPETAASNLFCAIGSHSTRLNNSTQP